MPNTTGCKIPLGTTHEQVKRQLQWRHNRRDGVSNHQPHDCLHNRFFGRRSKKNIEAPRHYLEGKSPVTGEFPAKMASNAGMFPFDDVIMPFAQKILEIWYSFFIAIDYILTPFSEYCCLIYLYKLTFNQMYLTCEHEKIRRQLFRTSTMPELKHWSTNLGWSPALFPLFIPCRIILIDNLEVLTTNSMLAPVFASTHHSFVLRELSEQTNPQKHSSIANFAIVASLF